MVLTSCVSIHVASFFSLWQPDFHRLLAWSSALLTWRFRLWMPVVLFSGHIHLLWLRKVGAAQEGGLQVRIQIPGRQRTLEQRLPRILLCLFLCTSLSLSFTRPVSRNTVFILRKVGNEAFWQVQLRTTNFGITRTVETDTGGDSRSLADGARSVESVVSYCSEFVVKRRSGVMVWRSTFLGGSHHGLRVARFVIG